MKIKLFHGAKEICILKSMDDPAGISPRAVMSKLLEAFRDGEWLWINSDTRAVRYDSITSVEIVPEPDLADMDTKELSELNR